MPEDKVKESPVKDKTLGLTDDEPPIIGEGEELVEEGKEGDETLPPITDEGKEEKLTPELEALMKKKGFKDTSELAKAYEASERKQTELESEKRLRTLGQIPVRQRTPRQPIERPVLTKDPYDMTQEELNKHNQKLADAIKDELRVEYEEELKDQEYRKGYIETMKVVNEDPERFERLKPTLANLHRQYPEAPLSELMPVAEGVEKTEKLKRKDEFVKEVFGPDADVEKIKTLIPRLRGPATIAGGVGAGALNAGIKTEKAKMEDKIWDNIAKSDMRRE